MITSAWLTAPHSVRQSLLLGYLQEGDRLPTVKDVASDLVINPTTVVKVSGSLGTKSWPAVGLTSPAACHRTRRIAPGPACIAGEMAP